MTDKIRITGTFGESDLGKVQSFTAQLTGVQTASFLRDGVEQLPQPEAAQEGAESATEAS